MLLATHAVAIPDDAVSATPTVARTPFYLQSKGQAIFAWLHCRDPQLASGHGVVICPPIGYEQIHAHRGMRHLADALALAGFAVLRLDYHGTGDSAGIEEEADRYATWMSNIRDAMLWLRQRGCSAVSLVGIRIGASLAMQIAAETEVENLVLWVPVVKGRRYLREMKAIGLTAEKPQQTSPSGAADMEAAGFVITRQTADAITSIDLLNVRPLCKNMLVVNRDDIPDDQGLLEHLASQGIDATQMALPGYADMIAEPHFTKVPSEAISGIIAWLSERSRKLAAAEISIADVRSEAMSASIAHVAFSPDGLSTTFPVIEQIVQIGERPSLIGILSEPEGNQINDRPLILLVNAGAAHRVGPNRFYVLLARQLACQGLRCLRMDLSGRGDSIARDGEPENDSYSETSFRDIELALAYAQAHLRVQQVVLMGLCSGAYMAFQSAAQSRNKVLVESVLINPLTFFWRNGMTIESELEQDHYTYHYYMRAALQPRKWLKLLSGRTKIGLKGAFKLLARRLGTQWVEVKSEISESNDTVPGHPLVENVAADLERVRHRKRRLAFFFSQSDPGYSLLMHKAGRKVEELKQTGDLKLFFIKNADHTFSERTARLEALRAISKYLDERYGGFKGDPQSDSRQV